MIYGGGYMYQQKYQMYVRVTPDRESDPEWPGKKKWFDSSRWLKDPRYIKISDSYVLNAEYKPIDNLNDFRITLTLQEAIKKSIDLELGLLNLDGMDNQSFFRHMKDNLSCEYLRTQFNSQTLTPVNDYFLFFFTYDGRVYEVEMLREPYGDGFSFPYASLVHKAGYWHSTSPAGYSYRDYLEGKPVK
ncbi:conserved hypothetical protein [Erwinia amylovora ATCC 49946]|nr:hypothetical protein [Erwinia amylovora]CBJ45063.1 conserved hypothetical protein [Erwinia amylovora ATCC 49946]